MKDAQRKGGQAADTARVTGGTRRQRVPSWRQDCGPRGQVRGTALAARPCNHLKEPGSILSIKEGLESRFSGSKVLGCNFLPSPSYKIPLPGARCLLRVAQRPLGNQAPQLLQGAGASEQDSGWLVLQEGTHCPLVVTRWKSDSCGAWRIPDRAGFHRSCSSPRPPSSVTSATTHPVVQPGLPRETPLSLISLHLCHSPCGCSRLILPPCFPLSLCHGLPAGFSAVRLGHYAEARAIFYYYYYYYYY